MLDFCMQPHNPMTRQSKSESPKRRQLAWPPILAIVILALGTLSCAWANPSSGLETAVTRTAWPTFTPVSGAAPPEEGSVESAASSITSLPDATSETAEPIVPTATRPLAANSSQNPGGASEPVAAPAVSVSSETPGWSVARIQAYTGSRPDSLVLYGEVKNDTETGQELGYITGIFYDAGGQIIADNGDIRDYWSIDVVPPGERVPFRLTVDGVQSAAKFDFRIVAEPSDQILRQDFELLDLNPWQESGEYCVTGRLRNPSDALRYNLTLALVLYGTQDQVLNFGDYFEPNPEYILGDETLDFEICVDDLHQNVARYELRAWGE
jgi:hypothetical protein